MSAVANATVDAATAAAAVAAAAGAARSGVVYADVILRAVPIFLLLILCDALYCHVVARNGDYRFNDTVSSLSLGTMSRVTGLYIRALTVVPFEYVHAHYALWRPFDDPHLSWPVWLATTAALVLGIDLAYYAGHRFAHACNLAWAGHIAHHSSEEYNLSTALRQNALETAFAFVMFVPLALVVPYGAYRFWFELNLCWQFWVHTKRIGRMPAWFEFVFVTPSHHRVHHAVNPCYIDRNFGGMFVIWDRLFGTYAEEREAPVYGNTTPLRSFDPLWTSIHHFFDIYDRLTLKPRDGRIETWSQKLRLLWKGPGFSIKDNRYYPAPHVDARTFQPFNPPTTARMRAYVLAQNIVASVATLALPALAKTYNLAWPLCVACSVALAWTLSASGRITDGRNRSRGFKPNAPLAPGGSERPWAVHYERARLAVLLCAAGVVEAVWGRAEPTAHTVAVVVGAYVLVSSVAFELGGVRDDCLLTATYVPPSSGPVKAHKKPAASATAAAAPPAAGTAAAFSTTAATSALKAD